MSSKFASPFMAKSPLKQDKEPRRVKTTKPDEIEVGGRLNAGESTEYMRGGRKGEGSRTVTVGSRTDEEGKTTYVKAVDSKKKSGKYKTGKVKEISKKRYERIKKRKEKTHSTKLK